MSLPCRSTPSRSALLSAGLAAVSVRAASGRIDDRDPGPGELGYRPLDGSTVTLNPLAFIWLHETGAVDYERLESPTAGGVKYERAGEQQAIAPRRADAAGSAELAGYVFEGPIAIKRAVE